MKILFIILLIVLPIFVFSQQIVEEDLIDELNFWNSNLNFEYEDNTLYIYDYYSSDYSDVSLGLSDILEGITYYLKDIQIDLKNLDLNVEYTWGSRNYSNDNFIMEKLHIDPEWLIAYTLTESRKDKQAMFDEVLNPIYRSIKDDFQIYQSQQVEQAIFNLKEVQILPKDDFER